jgi:hypothetical protein
VSIQDAFKFSVFPVIADNLANCIDRWVGVHGVGLSGVVESTSTANGRYRPGILGYEVAV